MWNMKQVKLTARLKVLTGMIEDGASVADIGTDHGYLPVYLAQTGSAGHIIASDISAFSIKTAQKSADKYNVTDLITFIIAPGLDGIGPNDVDTVVIAGLGGETIRDIIGETSWIQHSGVKLILQPQTKAGVLFRFLYDNGYEIREIKHVLERGKNYTIIKAGGWTV